MDVQARAAMQIQVLALVNARATIERTQGDPVPADATPAQHADVILQLSAAAQNLLS